MSTTCKYCNEPECKQDKPGLICETCICFVHLNCLRRQGTPGNFACDVFFDFTCEDCAPEKREVLKRNRFQWVNVILLTLNHLHVQMQGISNHGFFHYKTHICSFIDRYWLLLFGPRFKQKKNWVGTIAGALSVYSNLFFRSGSAVLGEAGWWKLQHAFSPAVAAHIIQEIAREKPKGRIKSQIILDKWFFVSKITAMGYRDYYNEDNDPAVVSTEAVPCKKRRVDSDEHSGLSSSSTHDQFDSDARTECLEEAYETSVCFSSKEPSTEVESIFRGFEYTPVSYLPPSDSSSLHSYKQSTHYDSDSSSHNPFHSDDEKHKDAKKTETKTKKPDEKVEYPRESLFSTQLNSVDMPWVEKEPEKRKDLVELTEYEEIHLLKNVENLIPRVKDPEKKSYLYRLKAKLSLRRLKRHKHLPIFDIDKAVKLLGGYVTEDAKVAVNVERVLDRFQRSYLIDNLCGTVASGACGPLLLSHIEPTPFRSAYSGAALKPYVRRDARCTPTWLKLTDELLRRTHRHVPGYEPPARASVDYSYVRPQHVAAVNQLCAQFFWPGIDLTEALQYPEFSCVVSYRRLVVGCAFLVPDADAAGSGYISFVLVRPEWSGAGLGSFMLYHLLQTCSGKDVTLHVSPTNPAIFLYQKFGFKVEELMQDFYEKYYDIDYKGCRHALFLRLTR